jgi:hypothetical protein
VSETYTAVCIGGTADGRMVTSDLNRLHFPVHNPMDLRPVHHTACESHLYRVERFTCNDGMPPKSVLIHDEISIREAFNLLTEAYAGRHIPKHSEAESRRLKGMEQKIDALEKELEEVRRMNRILHIQLSAAQVQF